MTNRGCLRHSHKGSSRAYRLVLARHVLDRELHQHILDEHGDCAQCLRDTVAALSDCAHGLLLRSAGIPEMHGNGVVTGAGITWLLGWIDDLLACEQADRRDLERDP